MAEGAAVKRFGEMARGAHLPSRIREEIGAAISGGRLEPGARLPTESALAASFAVSRSVVREAIAQLRNEGLVETRQGSGAFVTDPRRRATIRVDQESLADPAHLRHFFQLRLPLEIEAARLAAENREAGDLEAIDRALGDMVAAADWMRDGIPADLAFHRAVAAATRNPYFERFLGFISEKLSATIHTGFVQVMRPDLVALTIDEHRAIRDAVARGDGAEAEAAMRRHLTGARERLGLSPGAS